LLIDALDELVRSCAAFAGLVAENMTRGAGWHFIDMGRRIERGVAVARTVGALLAGPAGHNELALKLALELCDSTITHRTRYPAEPRPASVLDLVLADPANPRGLIHQLLRLREHLEALAKEGGPAAAIQSAAALADRVAQFEFARIEHGEDSVDLAPVLALLDLINERMMSLSDLIARSFFSHTQTTKPVGFTTRLRRDPAAAGAVPA